MQWAAGWFFLGMSSAFLVGTLLSFLLGGPAWPYLFVLGLASATLAMVLLLRSGEAPAGPTRAR